MLGSIIPFLIDIGQQLLDSLVDGKDIGTDGVKGIQTAYIAAKIWLRDVVDNTLNTYDNAGLDAFLDACEDAASEGEFSLPQFEE